MSRTARLDLRSFQQELATRLATKTAAQVESSRLGLACGSERWLIRLGDAGEVIAVPPIVSVPLTKRWFLGVANIRGNLNSVVDFRAFLGGEPIVADNLARLILLSVRAGEQSCGILVERVLGLRNLAQFKPAPGVDAPSWHVQRWLDADDDVWQEIDLRKLARDPAFLQVGA